MGRDKHYPLSSEVKSNAELMVHFVNEIVLFLELDGVVVHTNPTTGSVLTSGWRPAELNATVPGAAVKSRHILGLAADIYDPDGEIDDYLLDHQDVLITFGLYMEHPSATKGWCHVQLSPPKSGKRVFYP